MSQITSNALITNKLVGPPSGAFYPDGAIIQTQCVFIDTPRTQTFFEQNFYTLYEEVRGFRLNFTPKSSGNKILLYCKWCGQFSYIHNSMFAVLRNPQLGFGKTVVDTTTENLSTWGSAVGTTTPMLSYGGSPAPSTPQMATFWAVDSPNTTSTINYVLGFQWRATATATLQDTLYTNRTIADTDNNQYERFLSMMIAMEISAGPA